MKDFKVQSQMVVSRKNNGSLESVSFNRKNLSNEPVKFSSKFLAKALSGVSAVNLNLTKADARSLLQLNRVNKPVEVPTLNKLIKTMNTGKWSPNVAPITLRTTLEVSTGQHRLIAFIESDLEVLPVLFSFNVTEEQQLNADKHNKKQALGMELSKLGLEGSLAQIEILEALAKVKEVNHYRLADEAVEANSWSAVAKEKVMSTARQYLEEDLTSQYEAFLQEFKVGVSTLKATKELAVLKPSVLFAVYKILGSKSNFTKLVKVCVVDVAKVGRADVRTARDMIRNIEDTLTEQEDAGTLNLRTEMMSTKGAQRLEGIHRTESVSTRIVHKLCKGLRPHLK